MQTQCTAHKKNTNKPTVNHPRNISINRQQQEEKN